MFNARSYKKELLDERHIPKEDLIRNLKELHTINRLLGGYKVILSGVKKILEANVKDKIKILDIGSGGGDTLKAIHNKFNAEHTISLTGVDLKEDCINYARSNSNGFNIQFIQSDYRNLMCDTNKYDIIIVSLFCHHLNDHEIVSLLKWMRKNAERGIVINDLHRHFLAYHSIRILTQLFSSSYLVKNDAPLSVLRAFRKHELIKLMEQAEISDYQIIWKWAFRWMICIKISNK